MAQPQQHYMTPLCGYANQPPQPIPVRDFGIQNAPKFWEITPIRDSLNQITAASENAIAVNNTDYTREEVVRHALSDLMKLFFPMPVNQTDNQPYWRVIEEANRPGQTLGGATYSGHPDIVVIRVQGRTWDPNTGAFTPQNRDYLWNEVKAPSHNQPNEWFTFLNEVIDRLVVAHPNTAVLVKTTTGTRFMTFLWDPIINAGSAPMMIEVDQVPRNLNSQNLQPFVINAAAPTYGAGFPMQQHWWDPTTGVIMPQNAHNAAVDDILKSTDGQFTPWRDANNQCCYENEWSLAVLQRFLFTIAAMPTANPLQGINPQRWAA